MNVWSLLALAWDLHSTGPDYEQKTFALHIIWFHCPQPLHLILSSKNSTETLNTVSTLLEKYLDLHSIYVWIVVFMFSRGTSNCQPAETAGSSQDDEQPGPSRRKRQLSMSETMPLYTLCKEDLESMDKEVHGTDRKRKGGKCIHVLIVVFLAVATARWQKADKSLDREEGQALILK